MIGLGTLLNAGAIAVGTTIGLRMRGGMPVRFEHTLHQGLGLSATFIGLSGAMAGLLSFSDGKLDTQHTMLLVLCMVLGALVGEGLSIERRLDNFGTWCQKRLGGGEDDHFVDAFVTASLMFCVGAMAIVGALEDGLNGNLSILAAKSIMDGVTSIVFAATLGKGVYLSILPILLYQGGVTLLAGFIRPWLSDALIGQISCIGSVLIFAIGLNQAIGTKLKVGNLLPAILFPVVIFLLGQVFPPLLTL